MINFNIIILLLPVYFSFILRRWFPRLFSTHLWFYPCLLRVWRV